jgi:hypothetical protein
MEKKELREDKYLNHIVPLIVKGMHWGQEYIINSEDQEKIVMDKLVDFISQELDKAREEGRSEVLNKFEDLNDVVKNDEFKQYQVWQEYLTEELSKLNNK